MRWHHGRHAAVTLVATISTFAALPSASAESTRSAQWHLQFMSAPLAHRISQGQGVVVAVVDSGVDAGHPDLAGSVRPGVDLVHSNGDGRRDADGHGTAMAGLIAAHGHGPHAEAGTLGLAPKATILPVRVGVLGRGNYRATAGIEWAANHGADVICVALGSDVEAGDRRAVAAAAKADAVVVAAVGNAPNSSRVEYPAAVPGVLAAAGVDRTGNHAPFSVAGPQVILAAPAVDITAPWRNGGYQSGTGTSGAAAILAGAAALVRAKYPNLSAQQVIHRLTATATDKGAPGRDNVYGYGVVNLVAALTADVPLASDQPDGKPTSSAESAAPAGHGPVLVVLLLAVLLLAAAGVSGGVILSRRTSR